MNSTKYSNLPDIDTSQDVYETEDTFQTRSKGDSDDEESGIPTRPAVNGTRAKNGDSAVEGLDLSNLIGADKAGKRFQKAERRREHRPRLLYSYPSSSPPSPTSPTQTRSLGARLRALQAELDSLEADLADPSNPLLRVNDVDDGPQIDTGALMRGLVDVRGRLEKVKKGKEGRGRLVGVLLEDQEGKDELMKELGQVKEAVHRAGEGTELLEERAEDEKVIVEDLDKRVGELENLIGSSSVALDETSPLPAPLLPMLTKLNAQLALLTQPRHLDSISRRLKLLISDLDRLNSSQQSQAASKRSQTTPSRTTTAASSALQEQLLTLLSRLAPHLPHLPHMLTRMRTLSSLHAAASDFQGSLGALEEEQLRTRNRLDILTRAVEGVEKSLDENAEVVRGNVGGLEGRVEQLVKRLDALG